MMAGDIEHILVVVTTVLGSILLFAYLGFIVHSILFRENGFHDSFYHMFIFLVLFSGLVIFSIFFA
jgi:hypothetical protein